MIQTARGPVAAEALGVTLMHEHLCILSDGVVQAFPRVFDREAAVVEAVARLDEVAALGVRTVVDVTVLGLGRDIELMAAVAARSSVNVVVATGAYTFDVLPPYFRNRPVDHLAEQFIADICEGIGDSGIRAGMLKCTTDAPGVTPDVDKLLRATARAHLATGIPITTHSNPRAGTGRDQLRIFREEGVDPRHVVIGHCGDSDDLDYLLEIADSGAFLGMDRFGIESSLPNDRRIATLVELHRRGYGAQLVVSHDYCCTIDWFPRGSSAVPPRSIGQIFADVLPALRERGFGDTEIDGLMVDNPRRALAGRAG
jgi:phosphotriesterase-related protein